MFLELVSGELVGLLVRQFDFFGRVVADVELGSVVAVLNFVEVTGVVVDAFRVGKSGCDEAS